MFNTAANPCRVLFWRHNLQTVAETLAVRSLELEVSRLRLIIGDLRDELEMWREDHDNPYSEADLSEWQAETDKLMYGGNNATA